MTTAKGEVRRIALLDATIRVLARDGQGGVTHRSVAAEAGVPLAAATYYFSSIDDLFVHALVRATDAQVALFEPLRTGDLAGFARALHDWAVRDRAAAIAQYELLFTAMRRDDLRGEVDRWYRSLAEALAASGIRSAGEVAQLAIDGLIVRLLLTGRPSQVRGIEAALNEILPAT